MKEERLKPPPTPPKERFRKVTKQKTRPSTFLEGKCQVMENLLGYFDGAAGSLNKPVSEKLLVFLAQIDFWDWEMENLIFSFTNFKDRSRHWTSIETLSSYILKNFDIMVEPKIDAEVFWKRYVRGTGPEVTIPWDRLIKIVDKWNNLLTYCEQRILAGKKATKAKNVIKSLFRYRKKVEVPMA